MGIVGGHSSKWSMKKIKEVGDGLWSSYEEYTFARGSLLFVQSLSTNSLDTQLLVSGLSLRGPPAAT